MGNIRSQQLIPTAIYQPNMRKIAMTIFQKIIDATVQDYREMIENNALPNAVKNGKMTPAHYVA